MKFSSIQPPSSPSSKELTSMKKWIALSFIVLAAVAMFMMPTATASASSPWWQVLTGSRPTHIWVAEDNVQEVEAELVELFGFQGAAAKLEVEGKVIGCLGTKNFLGEALCGSETGFLPTETALELEVLLEAAFGTSAVDVTGGPVGSNPLVVTTQNQGAPSLEVTPLAGNGSAKIVSEGGSGRLIVTLTNLGDAPVNGATTPVTVVDELPEGVKATGVEAFAGPQGNAGPVDCSVEAGTQVSCVFEGTLRSYDAIEVEILASLTVEPPVAGEPGKVTVAGGEAPTVVVDQPIQVSPAEAPFGFERFSARSEEEGGSSSTRAGSHPFQLTTTIQPNSGRQTRQVPSGLSDPNARPFLLDQPGLPRNFRFPLPAGLVGSTKGVPNCPMSTFFEIIEFIDACPDDSAIGVVSATIIEQGNLGLIRLAVPLFNLPPALGEPARFGFVVGGAPVVIDTSVDPDDQYRIVAKVQNVTQIARFISSTVTIWGTPGDPRHDSSRGWNCVYTFVNFGPCERPPSLGEAAFLRQPVSCVTPFDFLAESEPWNTPLGSQIDTAESGNPKMEACNQIRFDPTVSASPTDKAAGGSSGLNFQLDMPNAGLLVSGQVSEGQAKKVEVTLPEGVTVNPSQAEGLGACSPAQYAQERFDSALGAGCPESSKVGSVDITTPLLEEEAHGAVYVAEPYDNPFGSLLALYMVAKIPQRGVLVKQAGKIELNPQTGQLVTTFDNLPQIPFETFKLHFFEGNRAPLVMPAECNPPDKPYEIVAKFTPWHASDPNNPLSSEIITRTSSFSVNQGPNGAPCPSGTPPFKPGFTAGTTNNAAGSYSPFVARLTRNDDEQEFSRFSMKLPKGVIGNIAGIPFCSDAAIAAAKARTGPHGGQEEFDNPSCPAASQIGRTLVGAGVGLALTYAPGKIYLAGPYQGSKLSIVAITTAKVGPFDLGTVVIRQALNVNSETAEVSTDGAASDPIPHILQGVVTHARDIRVYVDRPNFILNPTNCERMTASSTVLGSGLDFGSLADDQAVDVSAPFQAADCASLGFKPKLSLKLLGGTKRGDTPRLRAVLSARKGDANIGRAQVTLPHSAFLEQGHIRTICTRVQFRAGGGNGEQCPKASVYGRAKAITPLLDEPLEGPVFLRSSDNELPDLVAALHSSKADFNLVGRIDSLDGRIRNTFDAPPDVPVTKFVLEMQGGKKGLIVNSTNICRGTHRAIAAFRGQNGRRHDFKPLVKAKCKGKKAQGGGKRKQR